MSALLCSVTFATISTQSGHGRESAPVHRSLWNGAAACGSLRLKPRKLHHLAPLLGFLGDELTELGGRAGKRLAAYFGKLCSHRRIVQSGVDLAVELIDDRDRRILRSG